MGDSKKGIAEKIAYELTEQTTPTPLSSEASPDSRDNWDINFSTFDIARSLRKLPTDNASGSDGIPNRIYAALADIIAAPLKAIYNCSIAKC